ncbi:MAG: lipopolysaccharide biosynthesis protein, partial [Candidatus Dormibacteraceae bacterium]
IARACGRDDREGAKRLVSSAFFLLATIAGALLLGFWAIYPFVPWSRLFNVTSDLAKREAGPTMVPVFLCLALSLPLGIVQKVQAGQQEGFQSNLWECLGSVLRLGALLLAVSLRASLPILALALMGVSVFVLALNSMAYFGFQRPSLRPAWGSVHGQSARSLLRTGIAFLVISVLIAIGLSSDNLVVAQVLGAAAVPQLAVPTGLASPLYALPPMAFLPMWSAYGEAIARGESDWVERNVRRLVRVTVLLTSLAGVGYVLLGPWAIHVLVGQRVTVSPLLLLGLALWSVEMAVAGPLFMVLNAAGRMRAQVWMYSAFTIVSIIAKIFLVRGHGIQVIPWATAISYLLFILIPLRFYLPRVLTEIRERKGSDAAADRR